MFRTRYIKSLMIVVAALAAACTDDPVDPAESTDPVEDAEPASLTINFSIADLGIDVSTRTDGAGTDENNAENLTNPTPPTTGTPGARLSDNDSYGSAHMLDPDNLAEPPTDKTDPNYNANRYHFTEAALVNGSRMTNLTVILIHRHSNRIVGVRRIPDPNCPNHDVNYLSATEDGEVHFPPTNPTMIERVKKNCILTADGQLPDVLRDEKGNYALDDDGHIKGLFGTKACVTFDYNDPVHKVNDEMLEECAKRAYPTDPVKQAGYISDNQQYRNQSAEKLLRGEYTILAIANYDHRVTTSAVKDDVGSDGTFSTLNVDETLEHIADAFHTPETMAEGIYPFAPVKDKPGLNSYQYLYDLRFLLNRTLKKDGNDYDVIDVGPFTDKEGNSVLPYIRPAVHQTLTAAKDFYLEAGDNVLDIELERIASRTRVEVKNYAKDQPLKVHSLEFSKNYTQSTTYLFRRNKVDRDYSELASPLTGLHDDHDGKGAPMVDYTGIYNYFNGKTYGAIVPFVNNMDSNNDGVKDYVGVAAGAKTCIFDALMYESHLDYKDEADDPDSFTYTIDVSYPGVTGYKTHNIDKIDTEKEYTKNENDPEFEYAKVDTNGDKDYIHDPKDVDSFCNSIAEIEATLNKDADGNPLENGESLCFLIQGVGLKYFLYEKADGTLYANEPDISVVHQNDIDKIKSYLWVLEKDEEGKYSYLKNLGSGKYMPEIPDPRDANGNNVVDENHCMKSTETKPAKFVLGVNNRDNNNNILPEYSVTFENPTLGRYLSVWSLGPYLSGWTLPDQGCQYRFYPVKMLKCSYTGTPRVKKKVELTTFSDATGYVEKVREIKRNDFIRILVEVSYNPDASDFKFEVKDWKTGGGDVSFH